MTAPLDLATQQELSRRYGEYTRLVAKDQHKRPGIYDDDGVRQYGLIAFVRYFWRILEPETKFVDGWPLWAMCEHLEAVTAGRITRLLMNVPPGHMKAADCDTEVLTTGGWKRHGDLCVGEYVYGEDGKPKRILARTENKVEQCYEVAFDDGATAVVGAGHLWAVERDFPNQNDAKRGLWQRLPCVVATPELRYAQHLAKRRCADRIKLCEPLNCEARLLSIDPYLLGAWLGDGASRAGVLHCGDQDLPHFSAFGYPTAPTNTAHRIQVDCLTSRLRELGLLNNKHIPNEYLVSAIWQRWALLQGLMDTDGQVSSEGWCRFTTSNESIANGFMTLASSLGLKARLSPPFYDKSPSAKKIGPYFRIRFTPPSGVIVFRLARKQERLASIKKGFKRGIGHRYVTSVRFIGERLVNCIQVEDSIYLITKRLVPTHNSLLANCFWPAWEWGPMGKAHFRYVTFSYSASLTERDNDRFRLLIASPEYQALYGPMVTSVEDEAGNVLAEAGNVVRLRNKTTIKVINSKLGFKLASSVGGVGTGERGDRIIIDDPHNVTEAESDRIRGETIKWFRESISSRFNDLDLGALVIIMQRVHQDDISGIVLGAGFDYCHLMIPWEYDPTRAVSEDGEVIENEIGWVDPRCDPDDFEANDGEPAWSERFSPKAMARTKAETGEYGWAAQYQQSPMPRGGGLFKREWWQPWAPESGEFPLFDYVLASLDVAVTEKASNNPSGLTVWGLFSLPEDPSLTGIMLIYAFRKRLMIHGADAGPRLKHEMPAPGDSRQMVINKEMMLARRVGAKWGLVEWVAHVCKIRMVDKLLIEAEKGGIVVAQEMSRLYGNEPWAVQCMPVKGDKFARALAVEPTFAQGKVWAPVKDWSEMVIEEMEVFPAGKYDDLTDSATQAIKYLRDAGLAQTEGEVRLAEFERVRHKPKQKWLYPC